MSAERRVAARFGLALLVLIGAGVLAYVALWQAADSARWVDHTRIVIERLDAFLLALRDLEIGQHQFLVTGQSNLQHYQAALSGVQQNASAVRILTADNRSQQRRLDRLQPLLDHLSDLSRTVVTNAQNKFPLPRSTALDTQGEQWFESARLIGRQMRNEEYRLFHDRSERVWQRADRSRAILVLAMLSALGLLTYAILSLYRETRLRVQAGRALEESEKRQQLAVEASGIGSWSWDLLTGELLWSERCKQMFGLPLDAAVSYDAFDQAIHPDDRKPTRTAVDLSINTGVEFDVEYRAVWPDGSVHWLRAKGNPSRDSDGKAIRFEGIVIDIDERKRAELALQKSERRYSALFANKTNAIAHCRTITNQAGKPINYEILQVNHAYELITGLSRTTIEGKLATEAFPGIEHFPFDFIGSYGKIAQTGGELEFEVFFEPFHQWLSVYAYSPEPGEFIAVFSDVTQRKNTEAALRASEEKFRHLAEELEQRVAERTAALEEANHELEAFAYSVSHDLRAPLRGIDGFSRILLEEYAPQLAAKPQRYLQLVRNDARRMGDLVDDLLSFSRLSRQGLNRQPVDVAAIIEQVWQELSIDRAGRDVQLLVGDIPPCTAEPAMLKQVWVNLLANALKFSRNREQTRIEIGSLPPQNGSKGAIYFVKDNGVGFDMQYAAKLFGVFQRLHRAEDYEGTGVGLAIVQRIIRRHGGEIHVDAKLNQGAEFYFSLDGDFVLPREQVLA